MPGQSIHIDRFVSGLNTNRNPIYTPKRVAGMNVIPLLDTLIDGLNMELSPQNTLARRPGLPTYCSSAFGGSDWPLAFCSSRIQGTLYNFVDTPTTVYSFDPTSKTAVFTKSTTNRSYFQQVGSLLYFSDGTTNKKWDGVTVTNNGVTAPTAAPTISQLNYHDITNGVQTTHAWSPNYTYTGPTSGQSTYWLEDPNGNIQFAFLSINQVAKSANSAPKWATTVGGRTVDGTMLWTCAGPIGAWAANTGSPTYAIANFNPGNVKNSVASLDSSGTFSQTGVGLGWTGTYAGQNLRTATGPGTSQHIVFTGFGFALPAGAVISGVRVTVGRASKPDPTLGLIQSFGTISDNLVKLVKATVEVGNNKAQSGIWSNKYTEANYGSSTDLWGTTLGPSDINNSGFGVVVASTATGTSQSYILRVNITVSYTLATITGTYYSSIILDSNGNLQRVKTLGTTGGSAPTWSTTIGGDTTDNTMHWECLGSGNLLAALNGWEYGTSFHATNAQSSTAPQTHTSTLGPLLSLVAPIVGDKVTVQGTGSDDTQVDRVDIYRNYDGGPVMFYDGSVNNVNASTTWTFDDTALDTDLNIGLVGPIAHANDPAPAGMTILSIHQGRVWGAVGNSLYFTAGPDCTNGDPNQSWPTGNVFQFPETINALAATSQGLLVFTDSELWVVLGGPQTLTFYVQPVLKNFGVLSANCVAQDADIVYAFTSNRQLMKLAFTGKDEVGFDIADQLASFSPVTSCLAVHRSGKDEGLFISDGSANYFRYSLNDRAWSTKATLASGIGVIGSIETTAGLYTLLAGRPTASGNILGRSLTSFLDGASTYAAFAVFGSIVLSAPGAKPAKVSNVILEYTTAGTDLTVGTLINNTSGSFTSIPFSNTDPPGMDGTAYATSTMKMREHDLAGAATPQPYGMTKHLQVKVTLPTENAKNELLGLAINVG